MAQDNYYSLVQALKKYFVSSKQKHIEQREDGSYRHIPNGLCDNDLVSHIKGIKTVGIFSGEVFTKFLCFDVDTGKSNKAQARNDVLNLRLSLITDFGLSDNNLEVVDSGNKGYHVYLFFDDLIHVSYLKAFYREVLERNNYKPSDIEFRPTHTQGVKLPLGIHRVTGKQCYFVDPSTPKFKRKPLETIHNIKQINTKLFKEKLQLKDLYELQIEDYTYELCKFMKEDEAKLLNGVLNSLDFSTYEVTHAKENIIEMLETNTLVYPDSRNKYTLLIAIYLKGQGYDVEDTIAKINEIMFYSKRQHKDLIQSSEKHIMNETKKIAKYVYRTNITLGGINRDVYLYADELKDVLALRKTHLMKLYTSMLIHAKRHQPLGEKTFYMAYSVMINYGNNSNRSKLKRYLEELQQLNRISIEEN
ncbi:hypothetical protein E1N11_12280, partial [Staphylococcus epidermidis]